MKSGARVELTLAAAMQARIAVKSATLRYDVLSIAREASAAPAATFYWVQLKVGLNNDPPNVEQNS
jgi:hypothetical protein